MHTQIDAEALFSAIVDSSEDAIIATDLSATIALWNPAAEQIFGHPSAEIVGRSADVLVPPDLREREAAVLARATHGERIDHYETVRLHRDGHLVDVSLTISPIRDSQGRIAGLSQSARDITERRRVEREAMHLAALVESSDDAIASKDLDGIVQSWNRAAERLFGYGAGEMIGRSIRTIIPRERWGEEDHVLARVRQGKRVEHFDTIRRRKDGTLVPISLTVSPIRDPSGRIVGASKIARDISDRAALERASGRLAAIVDSSDDAIVSKDLNGIVQTWNRGAERMFGYTAAEAIGRSITLIVPEDRLPEEADVLDHVRRGLKVEHYETLRRRKDGTLIPISLTISPIRDPDGVVIGASKIARDVSALRTYATTLEVTVRDRTLALETANSQLESFAYSVSHDLRAPLRGMQGLSHALLEDYGDILDDRGRDYASRIVHEAALLDRLIQDLLAYSRLTRIDVTLEPVDVRKVVEAAIHALQQDIESAQATVVVDEWLPHLRANRTVLIQVLTNLLANAVKFGGERPEVRVRAERAGGLVRVWVEDRGIGIAPQHHERIFRAFERLHGIDRYPGTGIGLAIVRKGVERLGGRVGVQSEEGAGSRFWIELPPAMEAA